MAETWATRLLGFLEVHSPIAIGVEHLEGLRQVHVHCHNRLDANVHRVYNRKGRKGRPGEESDLDWVSSYSKESKKFNQVGL